jgi:hypothetical protein
MLFWNQKWAWWATAVMFILNNTVSNARLLLSVRPSLLTCPSF